MLPCKSLACQNYVCFPPKYSVSESATPPTSASTDMTTLSEQDSPVDCPPSYCLNEGSCVYFSILQAFACRCEKGYMGERCSSVTWSGGKSSM
ncbi:hypothetical protein JD844_026559 [Phrynosoma platyrhinos]|uniref:EGF-like domain-containing protein n=1 Tax=Phrynosoma platyrhinos TaxID=52577 RepID=A0ABQ7SF20_PHRPL|nr:hypothetical protein JD844_026559 [Phrynosoma platyrhinos]